METDILMEVLAYLIIAAAFFVAVQSIVKSFRNKKSGCSGCSSDCSGCSLVDLKKKIEQSRKIQ